MDGGAVKPLHLQKHAARAAADAAGGGGNATDNRRSTGDEASPRGALGLVHCLHGGEALLTPGIVGHAHLPGIIGVIVLHSVNEQIVALAYLADAHQRRVVVGGQTDDTGDTTRIDTQVLLEQLWREVAGKLQLGNGADLTRALLVQVGLAPGQQIVGDIEDEHDVDEEADNLIALDNGDIRVKGITELEQFNKALGTDFVLEDIETVAGLVIQHLGRVPKMGELIEIDGIEFEVQRADPRQIHILLARQTNKKSD